MACRSVLSHTYVSVARTTKRLMTSSSSSKTLRMPFLPTTSLLSSSSSSSSLSPWSLSLSSPSLSLSPSPPLPLWARTIHRRFLSSQPSTLSSSSQTYTVAKICKKGSISIEHLSLSEILNGSSMHVRDLFSLALTSTNEHQNSTSGCKGRDDGTKRRKKMRPPAAILPRRGEIITSFGNVRALIGPESGMIFDAHERSIQHFADSLAQALVLRTSQATTINNTAPQDDDINAPHIHNQSDPFELVFLEHILRDVCDSFNRRLAIYEPIVDSTTSRATNEFLVSEASVHRLGPVKESLQRFEMRVGSGLECLTHLLQNDDDMLGLLLKENMVAEGKGEVLDRTRHEGVELLLEEYARTLKNVRDEVDFLLRRVQSKQEMVAISMDAYRNKMIRMSLAVAITSLGFATSTTVAGLYGMNLVNGIEQSPTAFVNVIMVTSAAGIIVIAGCMAYISGYNMTRQTLEKMSEIKTVNRALMNMSALDYTIKKLAENNLAMDKEGFRTHLVSCHRSANIKDDEVDFLFDIFDNTKDGLLYHDDFRSLEHLVPQKPTQLTP